MGASGKPWAVVTFGNPPDIALEGTFPAEVVAGSRPERCSNTCCAFMSGWAIQLTVVCCNAKGAVRVKRV